MNKYKTLILCGLILFNLQATAAVYELQKCRLNEGKTLEDVRVADQRYKEWAEKNDRMLPTDMEIIFEFYGEEREPGSFYRLLTFDDFTKLGKALNERWDLGGVEEYQQTVEVDDADSSCSQNRMFWSPPQ